MFFVRSPPVGCRPHGFTKTIWSLPSSTGHRLPSTTRWSFQSNTPPTFLKLKIAISGLWRLPSERSAAHTRTNWASRPCKSSAVTERLRSRMCFISISTLCREPDWTDKGSGGFRTSQLSSALKSCFGGCTKYRQPTNDPRLRAHELPNWAPDTVERERPLIFELRRGFTLSANRFRLVLRSARGRQAVCMKQFVIVPEEVSHHRIDLGTGRSEQPAPPHRLP